MERADPDHVVADRQHADLVDRVDVARGVGPGLALRLLRHDLLHELGRGGAVHRAVAVEDDAPGDPDLLDQGRTEHVVGVARVVVVHDLCDRERLDLLGPTHHGDGLAEGRRRRRVHGSPRGLLGGRRGRVDQRRRRGTRRRGGRRRGVGVQDLSQHVGEALGDVPALDELHNRDALERHDGGVASIEEVAVEGVPAHLDSPAALVDRGVVGVDRGLGRIVALVECGRRHLFISPSPTDSSCGPAMTRKAS